VFNKTGKDIYLVYGKNCLVKDESNLEGFYAIRSSRSQCLNICAWLKCTALPG